MSPLVGVAVDWLGYIPVMLAGAAAIFASALMTFSLDEPRHHLHAEVAEISPDAIDVTDR